MSLELFNNRWIFNPDGEYNEYCALIKGHKVVIFSDREGEKWGCCIDDEETVDLEAKTPHEAAKEATDEIRLG